jgi:hypothetical protein
MKKNTLCLALIMLSLGQIWAQSTVPQDSLALTELYNTTGGNFWPNKSNWLSGPVNTWFGVTVNGAGRVTSLSLASNNVNGVLPTSFTNLSALQTLNLFNNNISALPAGFAAMDTLTNVNLANNALTFEDLEPIMGINGLIYSPQKAFGPGGAGTYVPGNAIKFSMAVPGTANVYQWTKDNVDIGGATASSLTVTTSAAPSDVASYRLRVTNNLVPGLSLLSNPLSVTLATVGAQTYFAWPTNQGISDDAPAESYGGFWADIDNDGDEDLMVTNLQSPTASRGSDLYENNGNGTFTRLTTAGNPQNFSARNITWADWDNDGYLDFYSGVFALSLEGGLYKNNKNKTFTKVTIPGNFMGGTFVDYDNNGRVDLSPVSSETTVGLPMIKNIGNNTFQVLPNFFNSDSTVASTQWVNLWADIDGDNDQDVLQVGNNTSIGIKKLFKNNGNGTFTEVTNDILVTDNLANSRGAAWADIDNDGDQDLFAMNAQTSGTVQSVFYLNNGSGNFTKLAAPAVLGVDVRGRACTFGDVDNDGDLDLVLNNSLAGNVGTLLFLNTGTGAFQQVSSATQAFVPNANLLLSQLSMADYNNDGNLDLYAATFNSAQPAALYRNAGSANSWLKIKLNGTVSNRAAIGAKVRIKSGGTWQFRQVHSQHALVSQNSLLVHFGIGSATKVDTVIVTWPSGNEQTVTNILANRKIAITENAIAPKFITVTSPVDGSTGLNVSLNVTCSALTGSTLYTIQLSDSAGFSGTILEKSGSSRTQNFTGLSYNTRYYARAKSDMTAGFGPITSFTTGTAESFAYVKTPANGTTGLTTTVKTVLNTVIGATSYTVQLDTAADFSGSTIPPQTGSGTTYSFNGLKYGTTYYTRVQTNLSPNWGPTKFFSTGTAEQFTYVVSPANGATNVSWRPVIKVNNIGNPPYPGYTVELSLSDTFDIIVDTVSSTSTIMSFANSLAYNTTYFVRVTSTLAPGLYGPIKSFTTGSPESFAYVTTPKDELVNVAYTLSVTSNTVPDATNYTIELNTSPSFSNIGIVKSGVGKTKSFSLAYNTTYYTRVYTDLNEGVWGNTTSFTTGNPLSLAFVKSPRDGGTGVPTTVAVTSNSVPGATSYTIELNTAPDFTGTSFVQTGSSAKRNFTGLALNTTYFTRVQTNVMPGEWGTTSTSFTTTNSMARSGSDWMGDESEDEPVVFGEPSVSVYPVPFRKNLTIYVQTERQEPVLIQLFDMNGREGIRASAQTNQMIEISGDHLAPGMYVIKMATPLGIIVQKIIRE